jgi:hypothetical protein
MILKKLILPSIDEVNCESFTTDEQFEEFIAALDKVEKQKDSHVLAFIQQIGEQGFATVADDDGVYHMVTKNCISWGKPWRSTRFDQFGPSGHDEHLTFFDAVRSIVFDYGSEVSQVYVQGNIDVA